VAARLDLLLYVITEKKYSRGRSLKDLVEPTLKGGASVVQLRNKGASTRELVRSGLLLRELAERYSALFIVNDRVDVALAVSADGVHLGSDDMDPALARMLLGPEKVIGRTVRTPEEALAAENEGINYLAAGSVYRSETKRASLIGLEGLRGICEVARLPVVAIGGITLSLLGGVFGAGASGVAVAKEILDTEDIEGKTREFRASIEKLASNQCPGR
jgi:thiamine-phosphate pyrophosphorylase